MKAPDSLAVWYRVAFSWFFKRPRGMQLSTIPFFNLRPHRGYFFMALHDYTFYDLINRNAVCFNDRQAWFEVDDQRTLTFAEYK